MASIKYMNNIDMGKNSLENVVIHPLASPPSSPVAGQMYYDTTGGDATMYYYNGSGWVPMNGSAAITCTYLPLLNSGDVMNSDPAGTTNRNTLTIQASAVTNSKIANTTIDLAAKSAAFSGSPVRKLIATNASGIITALGTLGYDASENLDVGGKRIKNVLVDGSTAGTDAVTKDYVDSMAAGVRDFKDSVRFATRKAIINLAAVDLDAVLDLTAGSTDEKNDDVVFPAQATCTVSGGAINSVTLVGTGSGYQSAPTVVITGGGGSGAVITPTFTDNAVVGIRITNSGSGYTNGTFTAQSVTGGGGSGATYSFTVSGGRVVSITVTAAGSGYTTPTSATVSFSASAGGSGATAEVVTGGIVSALAITNGGSGYGSAPTLSFTGGNGTGTTSTNFAVNDRILVKDTAHPTGSAAPSAIYNGIYYISAIDAYNIATLVRTADADSGSEISAGTYVIVEEGYNYYDTGWVVSSNGPITIDTDPITWTQFIGVNSYTAGAGLINTGNVFNVGAGTGITVNADNVQISATYAGQTSIVTLGTVTTGTWQATAIGAIYGGTGQTTYATGDILYASASNTLSKLAGNTSGTKNFLTMTSSVPSWGTISVSDVSGAVSTSRTLTMVGTTNQVSVSPTGAQDLSANRSWTFSLPQDIDTAASVTFGNITLGNGGALRTTTTAGQTLLIQARDVDGAAYTTFITLTANNTPTCDLSDSVTKAGNYIYRAGGTDVPVGDGGTGASTFTLNGVLYGNNANPLQVTAQGGTNTVLVANNGAPSFSTTPTVSRLTLTNVAASGGAQTFTGTPGAHTSVTAEVIDFDHDAHTMTITAGYTTQRFTLYDIPTITAGSALTVTNAATVAIAGAPAQAGSATITNRYALWVQGGMTLLAGDLRATGILSAGSTPTTLTDSAGKILSAALNTVGVGQGGTGQTTFATNGVLYGQGSSALAVTAQGGTNTVLVANGGAPSFSTTPTVSRLTLTNVAASGGVTTFTSTPGNHTNITAEVIMNDFAGPTLTATGDLLSSFRFTLFRQPTITASSTSWSGANHATVAIQGPPLAAGTFEYTTNASYPLWIQSGTSRFDDQIRINVGLGGTNSYRGLFVNSGAGTFSFSSEQPHLLQVNGSTLTITGTYASQRWSRFDAWTVTAGSAQTITNAATVSITGAPSTSGSAVITNKYALWIEAGDFLCAGLLKAGTTPTTLTDAAGKILSTALNTVQIAQGGTNATSFSATNGVVYFNGTSLVNSSYLSWDNNEGQLTITKNPSAGTVIAMTLIAMADERIVTEMFTNSTANVSSRPILVMNRSRGSYASPTSVGADDMLGTIEFRGYGTTILYSEAASINAYASASFSSSSTPGYLTFSTTDVGSTVVTERMRIQADGNIQVSNNIGIGGSPGTSARVLIAGGTTAIAPLRIAAGTNNTTPVVGSFEYGSTGYGTDTGNRLMFVNNTTYTSGNVAYNRKVVVTKVVIDLNSTNQTAGLCSGLGTNTVTITHNLGTKNVQVALKDSTDKFTYPDFTAATVNTVTLDTTTASQITSGAGYTCIIMG